MNDSRHRGLPIREKTAEYTYTDPLLFIDNATETFPELNSLKDQLSENIAKAVSSHRARRISVYFRDLNTHAWTGIGENEVYAPSSMLKVSTLVVYLKLAAKVPDIMLGKMAYAYHDDPGQTYKPSPLPKGVYPTQKILRQMIVESDNDAMASLMDVLEQQYPKDLQKIYSDLELPDPTARTDDFLTPLQYSRLLRVLYNSTYVSRLYSEAALQLLTETKFDRGLVAGLPSGTSVAHKFGEHTVLTNGVVTSRQLHDCGVIYYPQRHYLLCVMTEGKEFKDLESAISDVSGVVYGYVDNSLSKTR